MTEQSFQAARKIMQQANYLRGIITKRKGEVAKWTAIEDSHRRELRQGQADGAKKMIEKSLKRLDEVREKFKALKFPDSDMATVKSEPKKCDMCGQPCPEEETYCEECKQGR